MLGTYRLGIAAKDSTFQQPLIVPSFTSFTASSILLGSHHLPTINHNFGRRQHMDI